MYLPVLTSAHYLVFHPILILFNPTVQMKESESKPTMKKIERNLLDLSTTSLQRCLSQELRHSPVISGLLVSWSTNSSSDKFHSKEKLKMTPSSWSRNAHSLFQNQFQRKQPIWSQNFWKKSQKRDWEPKTSKMSRLIFSSKISISRKSVLLYLLKNLS